MKAVTVSPSLLFLLALLPPSFVLPDGSGDWGYHSVGNQLSPSRWSKVYRSCGGRRQSPINIVAKDAVFWNYLKPIKVNTQQRDKPNVELQKSDTTVYLNFADGWNINFGNSSCLRPISIHWHWGSTSDRGSEHMVNSQQYPLEGHLVTYNCDLYTSGNEALNSSSGLHVFGMLYEIGAINTVLEDILSNFTQMKLSGTVSIPEIYPESLLPKNKDTYYRYEGSLTTPPCTENVLWTVFTEIQTVTENQMQQFRSLKYGKPERGNMVDNFRPVIPLVGSSEYIKRVVYSSFNNGKKPLHRPSLITIFIILIIILAFKGFS